MSRTKIEEAGVSETTLASDHSVTLSVPIRIKRHSGRKQLNVPAGATYVDDARSGLLLTPRQKALARAFRWQRAIDAGEVASVSALAEREGLDTSYVARGLNLTTLAPDIIAAILDDELPDTVCINDLAINPPLLWDEQRAILKRNGVDTA